MDELDTAVVAVSPQVPLDRAEEWFLMLCDLYDESEQDVDRFRAGLPERASERSFTSEAVEQFVYVLDNEINDPSGVLAQMAAERDELPRRYEALVNAAETSSETASSDEAWDDARAAEWYAYLTTGNQWAGWSGRNEDWDEFRTWFLNYADTAGVLAQATQFLDDIESRSEGKRTALTAMGVVLPDETSSLDWGDETAAWYQHLTASNQWAGWSGREEEWDEFRTWFLQYAESAGVAAYAQAFLDRVEAAPDKRQALSELGIEIAPVEAADSTTTDEDPAQTVERIEGDVAAAVLESRADLAEQLGGAEELERLVAEVLRERVGAAA